MKSLFIYSTLALLAFTFTSAQAKRVAPPSVPSVTANGVEYRVSHDHPGCIEAIDPRSSHILWFRQIYTVVFDPNLERDVQDIHITALKLDADSLHISAERNGEYQLDLKSLEVKTLKGSAVWTPPHH